LARAITVTARRHGVEVNAFDPPELDVLIPPSVTAALAASSPDVLVNTAGYTSVFKAETEPELAMRINGDGAGVAARAAGELGVPIIHISTDYVFDGRKNEPYVEDDRPAPLNAYGRSKLEGENKVRAATPRHVILRPSWVYSPFAGNFVKTTLELAASQDEVAAAGDQVGCPTSAFDLADGLLKIARVLLAGAAAEHLGTFHIAGQGAASWADLAERVLTASRRLGGPSAPLRRLKGDEYSMPAMLPPDSRLDSAKLARIYGIRLRPWESAVDEAVAQIVAESSQSAS
jgi:dTDP-4-dehydrorhamnose reductase